MRKLLPLLIVLGIVGLPALAQSYYISPDVPTDLGGNTDLPWEIVRVNAGVWAFPPTLTLPAGATLDSVHAMCSGRWLVSVEAAAELPPGGGVWFEPWDVFETDGTVYTAFFCGGPIGFPPGTNIDAVFLRGGDGADLVISFDTVTDLSTIGGGIYDPADLVEFQRAGAGTNCWDWVLVPSPGDLFFDASSAAPPVPTYSDVTGADRRGGQAMLAFDVPTTLAGPTYLPGQVTGWDPSVPGFFLYDAPPWPPNLSSRMDAFSFLPGPGEVPSMHVDKSTTTAGNIVVTWTPSTSAGAEDYAVYEGTLLSWYSHHSVTCTDTGSDLQEDFTPQAADSYYLVVALNPDAEGSYGRRSSGVERPQLAGACRSAQDLDCP